MNNAGQITIDLTQQSILVVDDSKLNRLTIEKLLVTHGVKVTLCESGKKALKLVENNNYDLILLDIMMPEMDGHETCKQLKRIKPDLPVITTTSMSGDSPIDQSFASGAVDFIRKPITEIELVSRIKNVLTIQQAEKRINKLYNELLTDLDTASGVQSYIVPEWITAYPGVTFTSIYQPSQKVSGDIFDIIPISAEEYIVYIGDISGHGVQAALLMTAVKAVINMIIETEFQQLTPHLIMNRLSQILQKKLFCENYMTLLLGIYNSTKCSFTYFNAGHPPLIAYNQKTKASTLLESNGGIPVGWDPGYSYLAENSKCYQLSEDTLLLFYTDGLYECVSSEGGLGLDKLKACISAIPCPIKPAISFPYHIKKKLLQQNYMFDRDDCTLLALLPHPGYYHCFCVQPELQQVALVGQKVEQTILSVYQNQTLAAGIELIVNEFLNNIIIHGLDNQQHAADIYIDLHVDDQIILGFYDKGVQWEPELLNSSNLQQQNDGFSESGRGISIINQLSASFKRQRLDELNETLITINPNAAQFRE